jgi:hypothetical protein
MATWAVFARIAAPCRTVSTWSASAPDSASLGMIGAACCATSAPDAPGRRRTRATSPRARATQMRRGMSRSGRRRRSVDAAGDVDAARWEADMGRECERCPPAGGLVARSAWRARVTVEGRLLLARGAMCSRGATCCGRGAAVSSAEVVGARLGAATVVGTTLGTDECALERGTREGDLTGSEALVCLRGCATRGSIFFVRAGA